MIVVQDVVELELVSGSETSIRMKLTSDMINSISLEKTRFASIMQLVAGTDLKVVALCMSDKGMPETAEDRLKIADALINPAETRRVSIPSSFMLLAKSIKRCMHSAYCSSSVLAMLWSCQFCSGLFV